MLEKRKLDIINYSKKMLEEGLVRGTGGNISCFDRKTGYMVISPSGLDYSNLQLEDIPVVDLEGNLIEGERNPSTELLMHAQIYKNRDDINAIIHVHSTYLTVLATLREDLPASNYMIALTGDRVPCAEYATFGTKELADNVLKAINGYKAALLANHGAVACESDLAQAYNLISELEQCAKVYMLARAAGEPILLTDDEIKETQKKFETGYGQPKG